MATIDSLQITATCSECGSSGAGRVTCSTSGALVFWGVPPTLDDFDITWQGGYGADAPVAVLVICKRCTGAGSVSAS